MRKGSRAAVRSAGKSFGVWLVAALIGAGAATSVAGAEWLVVRRDMGGSVTERLVELRALERAGVPVRIAGTCVSACTMYLGLPMACVDPGASLGFHGPSTRLRGIPLTPDEFDRLSREMAQHYPPAIRAWFLAKARMVTGDYITITGAEAIRMGAHPCP